MTFSIKNIDTDSKAYKEAWETILKEMENKFNLFQTYENISFDVVKTPGYTYQYRMTSENLPIKQLGIGVYFIMDMRLVIHVYYNDINDTFTATANYSYAHRGGGTNGHSLSDIAESSFKVIYSLKDKTVELEISNYELCKLVEDLQDLAQDMRPKTLNDEQELEFNLYAATKVKRRGELTTEEKRQIINVISYYIHNIREWERQGLNCRYSDKSTNELSADAKIAIRELNYSIYRKEKSNGEMVNPDLSGIASCIFDKE